MQNTLTVGFQAAAFIYYSFLVKLNTKTPVVWKKSKRMLANEPDKCILYLYHLHKIAHWQAGFLTAPLTSLTLLRPGMRLVTGSFWPNSTQRNGTRQLISLILLFITGKRGSMPWLCLHVNPLAYQGLEDKINSINFWVLHPPNAREGTVLEINQVGFVSTISLSSRVAPQGVGYQWDLGAQEPGGPDPC